MRKETSVEKDEAGVEEVGEDRVPDADEEIADDLCGREKLAQAGEGPVRGGCGGDRVCGNFDVHEELDALLEVIPVCGFVDQFVEWDERLEA